MVSNHPLFKGDSSPTYSLSFLEVGVFSPKTIKIAARWVAEALGAEVEWDENTKQAIIKMPIESED